ncbi:CvpA family protein [Patescibacteria group bacterium]|nr:CvpA family protein [Patescibacteria group bacterium]
MKIPALHGNWVDLVIILVLIYFISEAWRHGIWVLLADFAAFLGSLLISLRGYKFAAGILESNFSLSHSIANALGFLLTAILSEALLGYVFAHLITKLPEKYWNSKYSKYLAILPALGEGLILIAFILTFILGLPVNPQLKEAESKSKIGGLIIKETSGVEKKINEIFGGAVNESLTYFTIKPGSKESVPLTVGSQNLSVDSQSEEQMFAMVNKERTSRGVAALTWSPAITEVARAHAKDMWVRQYFSHYSPEGQDVGDRLTAAHISFSFAGENLALAPTVETAMTGLINSEGHRANILEPRFHKVGIGLIDNGFYGKMFVQVFTD